MKIMMKPCRVGCPGELQQTMKHIAYTAAQSEVCNQECTCQETSTAQTSLIYGYLDIWMYKNDGRISLGGGGLPPLKLPIDFMDTPSSHTWILCLILAKI